MNNFIIFFKKEFLEFTRTKKLYIFLGIFALFGMISPVIARYMQEIIIASMGEQTALTVPPTTWVDSYSQLYNNLTQMGGLTTIFMFMGCVVSEKSNGSAALTLTKNLSHTTFIMAKFIAAATLFILSTLASVVLCYIYTYYLFGYAGQLQNVFMGGLVYSVFVLVLLAITVLASTIAKSTVVAGLLSFCGFILLIIANYIPKIGEYLPGTLLSKMIEITTDVFVGSVTGTMVISLCMIGALLALAICILKKQEI
ncbi:MAG: ABC transporter permease [Cellulosilyticaceae bacterium]